MTYQFIYLFFRYDQLKSWLGSVDCLRETSLEWYQPSTNCQQIFINSLVSSRLTNQPWLKHIWTAASLVLIRIPALLFRRRTFCFAQLKTRWLHESHQFSTTAAQQESKFSIGDCYLLLKHFFNTSESVIVTQRAFRAHFILRRNDAVQDRIFNP